MKVSILSFENERNETETDTLVLPCQSNKYEIQGSVVQL